MLKTESRIAGRTINIPVNDSINGVIFAAAEGHSFIYAKFDAMNASGAIFGVRVIRDARGRLIQQMTQFTPADGPKFAKRYGIDPFKEFVGTDGDTMFRHISREAFVAATGVFLQHVGGTYGLLAEESTRAPITKTKSGNALRKKITTTMTAYTKPTWFWILPSLAEIRGAMPLPYYDLPNGQRVNSSAIMIQAGHGTDMPTAEYVAYQTSETQKSWSGLAMVLVVAVAVAVTAGAAAYFGPVLAGAAAGGGGMSVAGAAATGALVGGGAVAGGNYAINGGSWSLGTAQDNVVGGKVDIDPDTSQDKWNYRSRVNLGWQEGGVAAFAGSDPNQSPGAMADYFKESMPSLKDQPRGATLARDAMSGDVEKPQESSLGVDLGTTGLQSGGVAVENPFGDSLTNTGLQ